MKMRTSGSIVKSTQILSKLRIKHKTQSLRL